MGIGRRTARDHLKGLFRATGASRQAELIARLSRETLG
jgi:DNA-binding CsgD family transcriptional regulator